MSQVTKIEYNGLELGDVDSGYGITELEGLAAPPISTSELQKTERSGSNIYAQKYDSRIMQFEIEVMGRNVDDYLRYARNFVKAFRINQDVNLIITMWNGDVRTILARVTDGPETTYKAENVTVATFKVELTAPNPFFLDQTPQSFTVGLPTRGGFPLPAPIPFPLGGGTGGKFSLNNRGDEAGFANFKIYGPVVNPEIRNATTGKSFQINTTITAGNYIEIYRDQEGVFVLYNGQTNYRRFLIGDLFEIVEGVNLIKWNASTYEAYAQLVCEFYNPYLSA